MTESGQAQATTPLVGGRYRIERLLGRGGMGAVYAATDLGRNQRVALKRLLAEAKAEDRALFTREFRTLSTFRHPRIVEVFDYGVDAEGPYYTMELLEGADLSGSAPLPWREACACLREAASILGVLHARRLVHRDLSPRNFWRTPDGRLKLLDFGALAPFGQTKKIVGTAPFVAPEALRGAPLDQRTDLFALGALGYWLLTSTHAFHANSMGELPRLWERDPPPPSRVVKLVDANSNDIPEQLDGLIAALLRRDPDERPRTTADVIDTLNALAQLEAEAHDVVLHGYLESRLLVGRKRESDAFASGLRHANKGDPRTLFIEGPEGIGRSRLLADLATSARLAGAVALTAAAPIPVRPYAAAEALARALLVALPIAARAAARPYAGVLGQLSAELHQALGAPPAPEKQDDARDERARKQSALLEWLSDLSREHTLALLVDDVHLFDEESQALLSALAQTGRGHRVVLVVTAPSDAPFARLQAVQRLRAGGTRLQPLPLTTSEVHELLRTSFGEVQFLERLAKRLHRVAEGNPQHMLLLVRHLVQNGTIRYAEGTWILPMELSEESLPSTLRGGLLTRLGQLNESARSLARLMSAPDHGLLTRAMCGLLMAADDRQVAEQLQPLLAHDVVRDDGGGLSIAHEALRETLWSELSEIEQTRVHGVLGGFLAEGSSEPLSQLRAALHLLRSGQRAQADALIASAVRTIEGNSPDELRIAAPLLEEAVALLTQQNAGDTSLLAPLFGLGTAAYYVDRSYAPLYGDRASETFARILRFPLATKLKPFLGARLSLLIALVVAGFSLRSQRANFTVPELISWLLGMTGSLAGCAATCINGSLVRRYNRTLEPLRGLGPDHAATAVMDFNETIAMCTEDRLAETDARVIALMERFRTKQLIGLADNIKRRLYAGLFPSHGHRAAWRGDTALPLQVANTLTTLGATSRIQAEQLHAVRLSLQGRLSEAEHHRKRIDAYAIQVGSAWQAELWLAGDAITNAFWTHDAVAMKRAAQQLARLGAELPTFARFERAARGLYQLMRGRAKDALSLLEEPMPPRGTLGWARSRGSIAEAYNALGQHERARTLCTEVLGLLSEEDLKYAFHCLNVSGELAMAEAQLGQAAQAKERIDALLAQQTPLQNPLLLGYLHWLGARIALIERDFARCHEHLDQMARWYDGTRLPSLMEKTALMRRELLRAEHPEQAEAQALDVNTGDIVTRVRMLMTSGANVMTERAQKGLQIALELASADAGFIVMADTPDYAVARVGESAPDHALLHWAHERLQAAVRVDETAAVENVELLTDEQVKTVGGQRYCVTPLWATRDGMEVAVAALVLGFADKTPHLPRPEILRVIAEYLSPLSSTARSQSRDSLPQDWEGDPGEPANANASAALDESDHSPRTARR